MSKRTARGLIGVGLVAWIATAPSVEAGGISTQLGEVVVENLQIGRTYLLKDLANLSLVVNNTSEGPIRLQMEPLLPGFSELRHGAVAVPDLSWIRITEEFFDVPQGGQAVSDIEISIPDDPQYLGQRFQFSIWSHTLVGPGQGMALAYGLKSRIIFTIDSVQATDEDFIATSNANAGLTISPHEITAKDVGHGVTWSVSEQSGHLLTVSNPGSHEQTIRLSSQTVLESMATLVEGYEDAPDPSYLSFSESELVIPAGSSKSVEMYLNFPADEDHIGHDYMFIIHAKSVDEGVSAGVYARLFASVK